MSASRSLNRGVLLRSSSTAMSLRWPVEERKHQGVCVAGSMLGGQEQTLAIACYTAGVCLGGNGSHSS